MDTELINIAKKVINNCFDDKSWLTTVSCALRTKSGKIFTGINVDGIHGSCAEIVAIGSAIENGEKDIDTIVAVYGKGEEQKILPPCGNCRQIMYEINKDIKVILNESTVKTVKELLPNACE